MRTIVVLLAFALFASLAIADVNVTGKWTGSFKITTGDGDSKDSTALLVLTQNGSDITGSVGPNEGEQHTITKGKIDGDKVTLLIEEDGAAIKFDLVATADHITGSANIQHDGETRTAKIDVTRSK